MKREAAVPLIAVLLAAVACGGDAPTSTATDGAAATGSSETAGATAPPVVPDSPSLPAPTSVTASPSPEPLGRSVAHLRVTGDIRTTMDLPLAVSDGFTVTWCDTPRDCAKADGTLQIMGEGLGAPGRHTTPRDLTVTIEVQDRFIYVSGAEYTRGDCTVTLLVADERGLTGEIVCAHITNGTGLGVDTISVRGSFVAAS